MPKPDKISVRNRTINAFISVMRSAILPQFMILLQQAQKSTKNEDLSPSINDLLAPLNGHLDNIRLDGTAEKLPDLLNEIQRLKDQKSVNIDKVVDATLTYLLLLTKEMNVLTVIDCDMSTVTSLQDFVDVAIMFASPSNFDRYGTLGAQIGLMLLASIQIYLKKKEIAESETLMAKGISEIMADIFKENKLDTFMVDSINRLHAEIHAKDANLINLPSASAASAAHLNSFFTPSAPDKRNNSTPKIRHIPQEFSFATHIQEFCNQILDQVFKPNEISTQNLDDINGSVNLTEVLQYAIYKEKWLGSQPKMPSIPPYMTNFRSIQTFHGKEVIDEIAAKLITKYKTHGGDDLYDAIINSLEDVPALFHQSMLDVLKPRLESNTLMTSKEKSVNRLKYYHHIGRFYRLPELPDKETQVSTYAHAYIWLEESIPSISGLEYKTICDKEMSLLKAIALYTNLDLDILKKHLQDDQQSGKDINASTKWSDTKIIDSLMRKLNRPIVVIGNDCRIANRTSVDQYLQQDPIFVHYNGFTHYNALLLQQNESGRKILDGMLDVMFTPSPEQLVYISPHGIPFYIRIPQKDKFEVALNSLLRNNQDSTQCTNEVRNLIIQHGGTIPPSDLSQQNAVHDIKAQWEDVKKWRQHSYDYVPFKLKIAEIIKTRAIIGFCEQVATYFFGPIYYGREGVNGVKDLYTGVFTCIAHPIDSTRTMGQTFFSQQGLSTLFKQIFNHPVRRLFPIICSSAAAAASPAVSAAALLAHPTAAATAGTTALLAPIAIPRTNSISNTAISSLESAPDRQQVNNTLHRTIEKITIDQLNAFLHAVVRTGSVHDLYCIFDRFYTQPDSIPIHIPIHTPLPDDGNSPPVNDAFGRTCSWF